MYKFMNSKQMTRTPKNDTADRFRKHLILSKYFKLCLMWRKAYGSVTYERKPEYYKNCPSDKHDSKRTYL